MHSSLIRDQGRAFSGKAAWLMATALFWASVTSIVFAKPETHTVVIEAMQFSPQSLEVRSGDTVKWVNKDAFPHNAVAENRSFKSKEIAPDASWKFKAGKKGTYPYLCTLHPTMKAVLIVK